MLGILLEFLFPEFEASFVEFLELCVREREQLQSFGAFLQIDDVHGMSVSEFETPSIAAARYLFGELLITCCAGGLGGQTTVGVDEIERIAGLRGTGYGDIHALRLLPACGALEFHQQLPDGILVPAALYSIRPARGDGQYAQAIGSQPVETEELGFGERFVLFNGAGLRLGKRLLLREEEFLHRGTLGTPYVVIVLHHGCDV